jgi:branched-subunit amino acid transport protein AzlD
MIGGFRLALAIALMAAATALTRFLPFWVFKPGRKPPAVIGYLGRALPPAMLALLVVYCLRDTNLRAAPHGLCEALGCAVVALLHLWRKNALLSIFGGTAVYMALVQWVFA